MRDFDKRTKALGAMLIQANKGDKDAYRSFLECLAPLIRGIVKKYRSKVGLPLADLEDAVQETLLAIHLKRHTWRENQPIGPWIAAIARYKMIDLTRKYGRRKEVLLDEDIELAIPDDEEMEISEKDMQYLLESLNQTQRSIIKFYSIEGLPVRDVAKKLSMTEGAIRVALHRALKSLAETYRRNKI
jgi:RNA polymerase sigma-70 factor, ECF subfamily